MSQKFKITSNILSYIRRLEIMYRGREERLPHEIIINSSIFVEEAVSYDNWNNGTYGHNVILFLDEGTIGKISDLKLQKAISSKIESDLKTLTENIQNELIESLWIELADDSNLDYQSSVKLTSQPIVNPDDLSMWKPGYIRLFISHKEEYKKEATHLAEMLEGYGISSFVAHDTIEPLEKWQNIIIKGLQSMEIMIVFVTDGFFQSCWTNQEIGFALGRAVPIISLKLQKEAPQGFIQDTQAIICGLDSNQDTVSKVYKVLSQKLNHEERIRRSLIQAFVKSPNFDETIKRFTRLQSLEKITDLDIKQIIEGFSYNNQLYNCGYLSTKSRFINFLKNRTGQDYEINKNNQVIISEKLPF